MNNDLLGQALGDMLPSMSSDVLTALLWLVGCTVLVVGVGLIKDALFVVSDSSSHEEIEGKIFREYQRGGGRAADYDAWTEKQHRKNAESLWRKHRGH